MRYLDEFRVPLPLAGLLREMEVLVNGLGREVRIMEICGGHTHAIFRYGLHKLMPALVRMVHGPGCPVCVVPRDRVDLALRLAGEPGVILATYADMVRVPGSRGSLQQAQANGADVRMIYSPLDVLDLARAHPEREVVFFAIGFETTTPGNAMALFQARREGLGNLSMVSNHVTVPAAVSALLAAPDVRLDAFVAPGHVSMVTGSDAYHFLPREHGKSVVISGFEPLDILQSVLMILRQVAAGSPRVENQYSRAVTPAGNLRAQAIVAEVFQPCDMRWRGLGVIPRSGLELRPAYAGFDALGRFGLQAQPPLEDPPACQCGEILRGVKTPKDCRVFGRGCTPERPLGACMVSSEGACAAYYQNDRLTPIAATKAGGTGGQPFTGGMP